MSAKRVRCCTLAVLLARTGVATAARLDSDAVQFVPPHYDGAKDEATIIQVWGMGPATSTPVGKR